MKVLFDTNIVLDVLLRRQPFYKDAAELFAYVELGKLEGFLGATTVTTLYYFLERALRGEARLELAKLLSLFSVAAVNQNVLEKAVVSPAKDFEDAVLVEAALLNGLDAVVTQNAKDFKNASLAVFTPEELLADLIG